MHLSFQDLIPKHLRVPGSGLSKILKCSRQSLKGKGDFIRSYRNREKIPELIQSSTSSKQRVGEFLRAEEKGLLGHLCVLIGFTQGNVDFLNIFMIGGSFTAWSKAPTKVGLLPSHGD